jgi:hypothetical protein
MILQSSFISLFYNNFGYGEKQGEESFCHICVPSQDNKKQLASFDITQKEML